MLERDSPVVKLYDAETLALTDCLPGHRGPVRRCLALEGTDYLVSSGADACLIFWGVYTGNLRQVPGAAATCRRRADPSARAAGWPCEAAARSPFFRGPECVF